MYVYVYICIYIYIYICIHICYNCNNVCVILTSRRREAGVPGPGLPLEKWGPTFLSSSSTLYIHIHIYRRRKVFCIEFSVQC